MNFWPFNSVAFDEGYTNTLDPTLIQVGKWAPNYIQPARPIVYAQGTPFRSNVFPIPTEIVKADKWQPNYVQPVRNIVYDRLGSVFAMNPVIILTEIIQADKWQPNYIQASRPIFRATGTREVKPIRTQIFVLNPAPDPRRGTRLSRISDPTNAFVGVFNIIPSPVTINILNNGAYGNGLFDDQPAIQAAIESLAKTGGTVYFPTGTYLLNRPIIMDQDNVTLNGAGMNATTLLIRMANPLGNEVNLNAIYYPQTSKKTIGTTISNMTIDGRRNPTQNSTGSGPWGIRITHGQSILINYVCVQNWPSDGIQAALGRDPVDNLTIQNSIINNNFRMGIHIGFASNVIIQNNIFTNTPSTDGTWVNQYGACIDVEVEGLSTASVKKLQVINNVMQYERPRSNTACQAISFNGNAGKIEDVVFSGNKISGYQQAVFSQYYSQLNPHTTRSVFSNNYITSQYINAPTTNVATYAFDFFGMIDCTISNNFVDGSLGNRGFDFGYDLTDCKNTVLSDNTFLGDVNTGYQGLPGSGYDVDIQPAFLQSGSNGITLLRNRYNVASVYGTIGNAAVNVSDDGGIEIP